MDIPTHPGIGDSVHKEISALYHFTWFKLKSASEIYVSDSISEEMNQIKN
jgi:hypothetical protein